MKDDIKITQASLEKEIYYAKSYTKILDEWCRPLLKDSNPFRESSPTLLELLRESVRSSLISSICNIFANSNEVSLWRIINQSEEITKLVDKETYVNKIKKIEGKLEPFRNIDRNHNMPWRKDKDKKILIPELKEYILFAETVYKTVIEKINLSFPLNGIVPPEFDEQIKRNINWINNSSNINIDSRQ